jgi:hypothetical protein
MTKKKEYKNNRGMAMLSGEFTTLLFDKLLRGGYIDAAVHVPLLWPGTAVVMSSNDISQLNQNSSEILRNRAPFKVFGDSSNAECLCFENSPPMWSLPANTAFVRVQLDSYCNFKNMYAEVGTRRQGPKQGGQPICDDVEQMILVQTTDDHWVLMYPSLRGLDSSASIARSLGPGLDSEWEVGVNPQLGLFDARPGMRLREVDSGWVPRNGELAFGWKNYELVDLLNFRDAGTCGGVSGSEPLTLQQQTEHSDHRRKVEKGRFRRDDPTRLNQEHPTWQTTTEWEAAGCNLEDVPAAGPGDPKSFLISVDGFTVICVPPIGAPDAAVVEHRVPAGRGCGFKGRTKHAGGKYAIAHRRPHVYANVSDLRFLPVSRPESLWALVAANDRPATGGIGSPFDPDYMQVLGVRALGHLDVYEFDPKPNP